MIPNEITEFLSKKRELDQHVQAIGKNSLRELFNTLFESDEQMTNIRWTQYTPHFNDGEPCVFRINTITVKMDGNDEDGDNADGYLDAYDLGRLGKPAVEAALESLQATASELEHVFQTVFGDDAEVTVWRNGEIEVDCVEHD